MQNAELASSTSREGVLSRVVYLQPNERQGPSALRTAFENLMAQAHAETAATPRRPAVPGAFGLAPDPHALWDGRLLFDAAGNVLVQAQFARSAAARPQQAGYAYDALDQLAQAVVTPMGPVDKVPAGVSTAQAPADGAGAQVWRYHHDSVGNRVLSQQQALTETARTVATKYADGNRAVGQQTDEAGRPKQDGAQRYQWDAQGRLVAIAQDDKPEQKLGVYRYNQRGQRISREAAGQVVHYLYNERRQRLAELDALGRITREYVWLGEQLVAVIDPAQPASLHAPAEGFVQRLARTAGALYARLSEGRAVLYYVHANHLGAPVAMTDERGSAVWSAEYAPFGQRTAGAQAAEPRAGIMKTAAPGHVAQAGVQGVRLDLRQPGQWEDAESGLYYNDSRYYDPERGRYLSPDPLGLRGGLNAYAYVGNNPLGFSDPLGLVLFAFDGTNNTDDQNWLDAHHSSLDNVAQFRGLYDSGNARYVTGVGTDFHDQQYGDINAPFLDDAFNFTGTARIDRMIRYFDDEADLMTDDDAAMEVDIIGFSRGAAEARDFANQIVAHTINGQYRYTVKNSDGSTATKCQKVDFRFMCLWDTVLSTNSGRAYNLAIPTQFAYVAQAVALNEYRHDTHHDYLTSWGAFPLESIMQQGTSSPIPVPGQTRIERGFIGAHADIGGAFGADENQLSQVALAWMVNQATAAGVTMGDSSLLHTVIASPVIHDKSDSIRTGAPAPGAEDRTVRYRDGSTTTQRQMLLSQGMSYPDTRQFINYLPVDDPQRQSFVTGTVNMAGYLQWLNDNGYDIGMTVQ